MLKYSKSNLKKLEDFLSEQGYQLIYDKGHFKSGYCVVNQSKKIVINKFFGIEGKMNILMEIIPGLELNEGLFDKNSESLLKELEDHENTIK